MTVAIVLIARQTGFFTNLRLSSCLFPQNPALGPRYYSNSHISNRYTAKCHHFSAIATIATVADIHPRRALQSDPPYMNHLLLLRVMYIYELTSLEYLLVTVIRL